MRYATLLDAVETSQNKCSKIQGPKTHTHDSICCSFFVDNVICIREDSIAQLLHEGNNLEIGGLPGTRVLTNLSNKSGHELAGPFGVLVDILQVLHSPLRFRSLLCLDIVMGLRLDSDGRGWVDFCFNRGACQ